MRAMQATCGGINVKRINKKTARRLFYEGKKIYLLPCNVRLNNMWIEPQAIQKIDFEESETLFDYIVNCYELYTCNYQELGRYASYYIEEVI